MKTLVLLTAVGIGGVAGIQLEWTMPHGILLVLGIALIMTAITGAREGRVTVKRCLNSDGKAVHFTLSYADETVILEPGKPWPRTDTFKWVTRGLIEDPQSFQVLAKGAVEINAERITLDDPEGETKLELQINKHHPPSLAHKPPVIPIHLPPDSASAGKARFRVKLDHLSHLMIECTRGNERAETGLRGLPTFVQSGFMIRPASLHVDPLQRSIELDGVRFECSAEGAHQLEEALNQRYAVQHKAEDGTQILVRDNAASPTGFDIDFMTIQAGAKLQVKGHLAQDKLNVLQDAQRCELLQPGIILRLSPPNLLIRQRRPDGGEEPVPDVPDISYLRADAAHLQKVLNHPRVRRHTTPSEQAPPPIDAPSATGLARIRLIHNPQSRLFLWLECQHAGGKREGKAFTHHNVAELMHRGCFQHHMDVSLSIDNHRLSILNLESREEQFIPISNESSEEDLERAGDLLTGALKPIAMQQA